MTSASYLLVVARTGRPLTAASTDRFRRAARRHGLDLLLDRPGAMAAAAPLAPHHVLGTRGIVLGTWIGPDGPLPVQLSETEGEALVAGGPAGVISRVWGRYVMLATPPTGFVLRDPSGTFPCYRATVEDADFFASDARLLVTAGALDGRLDLRGIVGMLALPDVRSIRTGLEGCLELLPGMTVLYHHHGGSKEALTWRPSDFAEPALQSLRSAAERVRAAILSAIDIVPADRRVLLELSGGLDSSILAAALAGRQRDFACATITSGAADDDERPFASMVADRFGVALDERVQCPALSYERSAAAHLPRPAARAFAQPGDVILRKVAEERGCGAFVSGGGGDNVFCLLGSAAPAADRLLRTRSLRACWRSASEAAEILHSSPWSVFADALRLAAIRRPPPMLDVGLLSPKAIAMLSSPRHPWLDDAAALPPGKQEHVRSIVAIHNHVEGFDRASNRPLLFPLLQQPVLEACLSIPSWLWNDGGINRAVARRAFAGDLPPAILRRRSKGGLASFAAAILHRHRRKIRELLLEGRMARAGLLDLTAARIALDEPIRAETGPYRLLEIADIEAWCSVWS